MSRLMVLGLLMFLLLSSCSYTTVIVDRVEICIDCNEINIETDSVDVRSRVDLTQQQEPNYDD
jgi:hypothetical protein